MSLCIVPSRSSAEALCFDGGRAGVEKFFLNFCANILDITFDAEGKVTAITLATGADKAFQEFTPDPDTAFFNSAKTRTNNGRGGTNVAQQLSLEITGLNPLDRTRLQQLNNIRCLHTVVKDNNGNYHYAGINHYPGETPGTTDRWSSANMRTGDGSSETGADPTNDTARYVETLTANTNFYAPFYTGTEALLTTPVT